MTVENTLQIPYPAFLILVFFVFPVAVFFSILVTRHLVQTYSLLLSVLAVWFSYSRNTDLIAMIIHNRSQPTNGGKSTINNSVIIVDSVVQCALSLVFNKCFLSNYWHGVGFVNSVIRRIFKSGSVCAAQLPLLFFCLDLSDIVLHRSTALAVTYPICMFIYVTLRNGEVLYSFFIDGTKWLLNYVHSFGFQSFIESHWRRLNVPTVLRVFWCAKITYIFTSSVLFIPNEHKESVGALLSYLWNSLEYAILVRGCENYLSLAGMTSVVSTLCTNLACLMAQLIGVNDDREWHYGTVSAVLFWLLALQTGLTGLPADARVARVYRNLCLLSMAMLHFIQNMVKGFLLNLSTVQRSNWFVHARALVVCFFLICFPLVFLIWLWLQSGPDAWAIAVSIFGIELIVKVVFTLIQYGLFIYDAMLEGAWSGLDDWIYWSKAVGNSIHFVFGICLFANGLWIFLFESGGAIRAVMICIHAYFNIYVQGKRGWKNFKNRRLAVQRIKSLPDASSTQLQSFRDVCPVCYLEMTNAKVTPCGHLYHPVCLRKWLYIQDTCPMCHRALFTDDNDESLQQTLN